jgi:hypothetical protein
MTPAEKIAHEKGRLEGVAEERARWEAKLSELWDEIGEEDDEIAEGMERAALFITGQTPP